jgi:hypothetical protein
MHVCSSQVVYLELALAKAVDEFESPDRFQEACKAEVQQLLHMFSKRTDEPEAPVRGAATAT